MKIVQYKIIVKTVLPFIITVILFVTTMFFVIIPLMHNNHIERSKLAIKDLTITAWETLIHYKSLEDKKLLTREEAQKHAKSHIRSLRFGPNMKNYFWIITIKGVVVAHPYNMHMEGVNQISLSDADGKFFIKEFIETARDHDSGFVEYKWQWKDDPKRIETKISYVKRFHDWDWIIGTGVYLDDINKEVRTFSNIMIFSMFAIIIIISCFTFFIVRNFIASEKVSFKKTKMAKKTESKIRLMIQAIPDMLLRIDPFGRILDVKEPINFKPFMNPGEMLGTTILDAWPEDIAEKTMNTVNKTFETSVPQTIVLTVALGKKEKKSMKLEAHFVKCGKKEVLASFRDITKRSS